MEHFRRYQKIVDISCELCYFKIVNFSALKRNGLK